MDPAGGSLPASGDVDYTYEIVPTHFAETAGMQWAEVLPSARLMCITRLSIFGHRIKNGCAMRGGKGVHEQDAD